MNTDIETLINNYFEKSLSSEEQDQFDFLMQNDANFSQEVNFQKNLKKAISLNERENLKKKLQSFETIKPKLWVFKPWYSAAAAIVICSFAFYLSQNSTASMYDEYYQTYPNVVAPTVRGENNSDIQSQAFAEYDNGNYQKSQQLFGLIYTSEKEDYALFYKGLSQLELNKTKDAIATFRTFDLTKNNNFIPYVKWYLALGYLKENQKENAIPLLQSLAKAENPQQEIAQKLLAELE